MNPGECIVARAWGAGPVLVPSPARAPFPGMVLRGVGPALEGIARVRWLTSLHPEEVTLVFNSH